MTEQRSAPAGVNVDVPNVARIYDYWLGGKDNFRADREAAERILALAPDVAQSARSNRAFLGRAVRYLAESGVRQFLDIGTGLPTQGNVHEVAQAVRPDARVVYVDYDPVVCVHARALLGGADNVAVVQADMRDAEQILEHPDTRRLLNFDEPVAVLLIAMLMYVSAEDDPYAIVGKLRDAVVPGSYLAISHVSGHGRPPEVLRQATEIYKRSSSPMYPRSMDEIMRMFDGFDLVEPGLVFAPEWRPDESAGRREDSWMLAGVGRKR